MHGINVHFTLTFYLPNPMESEFMQPKDGDISDSSIKRGYMAEPARKPESNDSAGQKNDPDFFRLQKDPKVSGAYKKLGRRKSVVGMDESGRIVTTK